MKPRYYWKSYFGAWMLRTDSAPPEFPLFLGPK